ncbi:nuclear transport factor 2 family protein [Streptomyces avicenniae]|uniref:nuclear transport factor 2 family protein n=1 Tax=Streptomyces avicenniae TaxID=500153 RepID=UPI00069B1D08|nr:nuclear transport factor 2 family protein [Streptomyces avicenniae]
MDTAQVVHEFWDRMGARDWDGLRALLADDVVVDWPASGERFVGPDNVIGVNEAYPLGWSITVLSVVADGGSVVSEVEVPHEDLGVFRVASFWTVRDGRIVNGREYWTGLGTDPAPAWRARFARRI